MSRLLDTLLIVSLALPAAAATANTDPLNLGAVPGGQIPSVGTGVVGPAAAGLIEARVSVEAVPSLADSHAITFNLQHSLDDGDQDAYANIPGTGNMSVTGADSAGAAAKEFRLYLPPDTKPYIRLSAAVASGGGDNTGSNFQLALAI